MSQLKKGATLTYLNIFLSNSLGLILTPFIIRSLGQSEYGLYTLIGSFVSYLTLLDLGLNNSIIRFVAKYRAENDIEGERRFLGTAVWAYVGIAMLLVIIGFILFFQLDNLFQNTLNPAEMSRAKTMFLILILNLAVTIPGGAFQAICNAYQFFVFPRLLNIIKYLVRVVSVFAILFWGGKAISLVIIDTVLNISVIVVSMFFVVYKMKVVIPLKIFDKNLVKEIFSYSLWVFVYGIVHLFQWNAGQVVLGMTTSTVVVGIFGVGVMLGGYYNAFAGAINSMLVPKATKMIVDKKDGTELTQAMITVGRLNGYLLFFILTGFFLFGKTFINLWLGDSYSDAWFVALFMMLGMTMLLFQVFGNTILEAYKKNRFKSLLSLFTVSAAVIAGYFLSPKYGIFGVIYPLTAALILNSAVMNFYFIKIFNFEFLHFVKQTIFKQVLIYGLLAFTFFHILPHLAMNSWLSLCIFAGVYSLIYLLLSWFLVMNDYEKSFLKKFKR